MKRIIILASTAVVILIGVYLLTTFRDNNTVESIPELPPTQEIPVNSAGPAASFIPDKDTHSVTLPDELSEIIKGNRELMFPAPSPDLVDIVTGFHTSGLDTETDAAIASYLKQSKHEDSTQPEYLSHEEIVNELDYLFNLLKYGYGAYQYFGNDEVYGAVKELMLKKLSLLSDPVSNDSYLNDILIPCLKTVIADNHFQLGWHQIGIGNQLYMNNELTVRKVENYYITVMDGRTYRVLRAGQQFEGLLPTLTSDGELAWVFGWMKSGGDKYDHTGMGIELEDVETQEKSTHIIQMFPVSNQYRTSLSQDLYTLSKVDGITVLENRRLYANENDPPITEFVETGKNLRDEPVLILDLRCNPGGNDGYALDWVIGYTGRRPSHSMFLVSKLHSLTANKINPDASRAKSPPSWEIYTYYSPKYIPNDNLIIVLIDNAIGSSGESFIGYLRQLDNVMFVGTNTSGCLVTGNIGSSVLPASKQPINFCTSLNIRPDLSQFEGIGFMPDLWVPPGESLERVLQFVERYIE